MWTGNTAYGIDSSVWPPKTIPPYWGELLGYCKPRWISPYRSNTLWVTTLFQSPASDAQRTLAAPVDRLAVYGIVVTPTQVVTLSAFYHVDRATDRPGRDISGTYSIRFFDEGGALLQNYPFSPTWQEAPAMTGAIGERPPWISTTKEIAIWHGETALVTRTVSAHAPAVTMTCAQRRRDPERTHRHRAVDPAATRTPATP